MVKDRADDLRVEADRSEDPGADRRMGFEDGPLLRSGSAGLQQHVVRNTDLADVVEKAGEVRMVSLHEAHHLRGPLSKKRNRDRVTFHIGIARLECHH